MDDATQRRHLRLECLLRHELEKCAHDAFVSDDEDGLGLACAQMAEPPFDSASKIHARLAFRKLEAWLLGLPIREEGGVAPLDFFASQSLPTTEMNLAKIRFDPNGVTWRDESCGFPGAAERTRPNRFKGLAGYAISGFAGLGAAEVGERHIGGAVVSNARFAHGLPVADEDEASQSIQHRTSVARDCSIVNGNSPRLVVIR